MTHIFEQLLDSDPKESDVAYAAFCVYRDAGLQRSYISVAETVKKSYTLIRRWAKRCNWDERAKAYDRWVEDGEFEARRKEIHAARQRQIKLSHAAQGIVAAWLNDKNELIRLKKKVHLTPMEAARLLELAIKIESTAMGIPTEVTESQMQPAAQGLGYIDIVMNTREDNPKNDGSTPADNN